MQDTRRIGGEEINVDDIVGLVIASETPDASIQEALEGSVGFCRCGRSRSVAIRFIVRCTSRKL